MTTLQLHMVLYMSAPTLRVAAIVEKRTGWKDRCGGVGSRTIIFTELDEGPRAVGIEVSGGLTVINSLSV